MTADEVTVTEGASAADATVVAEPTPLLLWIWGRAPDSAVEVTGDGGAASRFRKRLALAQ